jgi:ribonuclease E
MMSSAIPARLQFQCGHAAMVSLPRVKGESATQRNDRVAREKSAALSRQCDFCAPAVVVAVNGTDHMADLPEPVVEMVTPDVVETIVVLDEEEETPVVAEAPAEVEAFVLAEISVPETSTDEVAVVETPDVVEAIVVESPVLEEVLASGEDEAPEVETLLNGDATASAPVVRRTRRPAAPRKARAEEIARGRRFLVEYHVETVLHAVDIHDALRQAANLGAAQLTAITREDS